MAESNVKTFTVTAEAASAIGGTRKRKRRTTAKSETMKVGKEQHGGTSPGTSLQVEANRAPGGAEPPSANFQKSSGGELAKVTTESSPAPVQTGGGKPSGSSKAVKVILEKKKKGTKVVLAPTKVKKLNAVASPAGPVKTRKVAKKIRISLGGLSKRVTRAASIKKESKAQSLESLKKTLVDAKLIKETSKAPEGVLRTMYADYMTLKNRAL
jgi:hypothetical protein